MSKKVLKKFFYCLALLLVFVADGQNQSIDYQTAKYDVSCFAVYFFDVGQADSSLIVCKDEAMLIDGGNRADAKSIEANLKKIGVKHLKYVVATHAHADHIGGLSEALNQTSVGQVFSPVYTYNTKTFKNLIKTLEQKGVSITKPQGETNIYLGMSTVSVYAPIKNYKSANNTSIVVKITHEDTSFLFTGDIESDAEKDLTESGYNLSATVLKVAHHGSRTSSSSLFLKAVNSEYAIISVGKNNNYGHPNSEILTRLNSLSGKIYRTDISGMITINSDGKNLFFSTQK